MRITTGKTPQAFAELCMDMSVFNPSGFRQPSEKVGRPNTTLLHNAMVAAGMCDPDPGASSPRGTKRRAARERARHELRQQRISHPTSDGAPRQYMNRGTRKRWDEEHG